MKKSIAIAAVLAVMLVSSVSFAERIEFPDKGWHKGFWVTADGGMMQANHDTNLGTNRAFNGSIIPAVGLSLGYDIADWIGPQLDMQYGFATDQVGDGTANYPLENAREHSLTIRLAARTTVPYFTKASWQPNKWKIIPYAKLGASAHGLYVNAPTNGNKVGVWGFGPVVGVGLETLIIDRIWLGFEFNEDLLWLQSQSKTVGGVNTKIMEGGFKPLYNVMGMVGYHF